MLAVVLGALDYITQETSGNLLMVHVVIGGRIFRPGSKVICRSRQGDTEGKKIDGSVTDSSFADKWIIGYFLCQVHIFIYSRLIYTVSHFSRNG
jgi:hypothetical protein